MGKLFYGVDNDGLQLSAKNQYKILCTLCCVKMTIFRFEVVNSVKFENLKISQNLSFCVGRNTTYFVLEFYRTIEYIIVNI
jgi:hypothetical protein